MYITIGENKKRYYPDKWQFTAYQFLNIHIDDPNMTDDEPFYLKNNQEKIDLINTDKNGRRLNYWLLPYNDHIRPTVGNVEIGYKTKTNSVIKEKIVILPSILDEKEFQEMAKMIGDVVFNCHSFTRANVAQITNQGINQGGNNNGANLQKQGGYSDYILNQLQSLFDVLEYNIPIIEKSPALSMRATKKEIQIHKSNKPKDLLARKLQPNKKITLSYGKYYDEYSQENKWLGYIIFEALTNLLDNLLVGFQEYQQNNTFEHQNNAYYNEMVKEIEKNKNRLNNIKSNDFIKKFDLKIKRPPQITTRLIKSKGYGEIVRAYQEIFNENFLKAFEFYNDVITAYSSGYLDNLSNIYEHWCLVVLYDNLLKLGFKPDDDCRLENIIKLQDDNLVIPSGSIFVLRKPFAQYDYDNRGNNRGNNIVVRLYYEPQIDKRNNRGYYTPDIKIDITAPKRVYGITNFSVILDAKFKDYQKNNRRNNYNYNSFIHRLVDSEQNKFFTIRDKMLFLSDIIGVSMYKYHYDLENQPNMSMILHPNSENRFLWRGEMDCKKFLIDNDILTDNNFELFKDEIQRAMNWGNVNDYLENCVSHQFGTLTLRPKELGRDIRRLFAIIFYYHMGLTSLCLGCGRELHEEGEFFVNGFDDKINHSTKCQEHQERRKRNLPTIWNRVNPTTAFRAVCKDCHTNWRVSFCNGKDDRNNGVRNTIHNDEPNKENRIIKLGINDETGYIPIHHKTNEGTYCPKCFAMKKSSHLNVGVDTIF